MELLVDALREFTADALDAGEVVDARGDHALQAAEMLEQLAPARRPHRGDFLQPRGRAGLAALGPVARDREAVRLVAHLLDEVQRRMVRRQAARVLVPEDELLHPRLALLALGDADHADLVQTQ